MPEVYTDDNGQRVIVRHRGPAGIGIPSGGTTGQILRKKTGTNYDTEWVNAPAGTGAVTGPVSSVDGNVVLFDGITGKVIKDSTRALSWFASASSVATKQDKEPGKGLSKFDFDDHYKSKLDNLSSGGFRGAFDSIEDIENNDFTPEIEQGDYTLIEVEDDPVILVIWDSVNEAWTPFVLDAVSMTGSEIATALFETTDASTYDKDDCRIFTTTEKAQVAAHEAFITSVTGGGSGYQPQNANLTALSGIVGAADKISYFTGLGTMLSTDFTVAGRNLVGALTAAAQRVVLGLGPIDAVTFGSLTTGAPTASAASAMKFGSVTPITDAGMTGLGFTHQQKIEVAGTGYWIPMKSTAWT